MPEFPSTYEATTLVGGTVRLGAHPFPADALGEDTVVIKPDYMGICRADIKEIAGSRDIMEDRGPLFGHEFIGSVVFSGARTGFRTGETVTLNPNITPTRTTGFADYVFVHGAREQLDQAIVGVPEPEIRQNIWMPEPFACIVHALRKLIALANLPSLRGKRVGIIGAGCSGLLFAMYARHLKASVSVFNRGAMRRDFARERQILAAEEIFPLAGAESRRNGFDIVIVASTIVTPDLLRTAATMAADGAVLFVYGGTRKGDRFPGGDVDVDALRRNEQIAPAEYLGKRLAVSGAYGCLKEDYEEAFRLHAEHPLGFPLEKLTSTQISLAEFPELAMSIAAGAADFPGKVLIRTTADDPDPARKR